MGHWPLATLAIAGWVMLAMVATLPLEHNPDVRNLASEAPIKLDVLLQVLEDVKVVEEQSETGENVEGEIKDENAKGGDDADEIGKAMKAADNKAKGGGHGQRKINVKQIDTDEKAIAVEKEKMHQTYEKLLSGKGFGSADSADAKKKEVGQKAKGVLGKDEARLQQREEAKAKLEAKKAEVKEKTEKELVKSKEANEKALSEKEEKSKKKAEQEGVKPATKEGLIQQAAEHRFLAYKLKMAAAQAQHQLAQQNATKQDVERADAAAAAAEKAAATSQEKAVKYSLRPASKPKSADLSKADKKDDAFKKKGEEEAKGDVKQENQGKQSSDGTESETRLSRELQPAKRGNQANGTDSNATQTNAQTKDENAAEKAVDEAKATQTNAQTKDENAAEKAVDEAKARVQEEDTDESVVPTDEICSEEHCESTCKTTMCFKFCMRCKKIKSERMTWQSGIGLIPGTKRDVHHVVNPAVSHALWVNTSMKQLRDLDKQDKEADSFVNVQVLSVYCSHCKDMCAEQHKKGATSEQHKKCTTTCEASVACRKADADFTEEANSTEVNRSSEEAFNPDQPQLPKIESEAFNPDQPQLPKIESRKEKRAYAESFCGICGKHCASVVCLGWCEKNFCKAGFVYGKDLVKRAVAAHEARLAAQKKAAEQGLSMPEVRNSTQQLQSNSTSNSTGADQPSIPTQQQASQQQLAQPEQQVQQVQQPNDSTPQQAWQHQQERGQAQPGHQAQQVWQQDPLKAIENAARNGAKVHVIKLPSVTVEKNCFQFRCT